MNSKGGDSCRGAPSQRGPAWQRKEIRRGISNIGGGFSNKLPRKRRGRSKNERKGGKKKERVERRKKGKERKEIEGKSRKKIERERGASTGVARRITALPFRCLLLLLFVVADNGRSDSAIASQSVLTLSSPPPPPSPVALLPCCPSHRWMRHLSCTSLHGTAAAAGRPSWRRPRSRYDTPCLDDRYSPFSSFLFNYVPK